jgi:hypothetical protein
MTSQSSNCRDRRTRQPGRASQANRVREGAKIALKVAPEVTDRYHSRLAKRARAPRGQPSAGRLCASRGVAQPGRALLSGGRSRKFESCHPDQQINDLANSPVVCTENIWKTAPRNRRGFSFLGHSTFPYATVGGPRWRAAIKAQPALVGCRNDRLLRRHAFEVLVPVDKLPPFPQSALLFPTIRQTAMGRILIRLFGLALVSAVLRVQAATADYAISFIPPSPIAGQPVVARLTDDVRTLCSNEQGFVTREHTNITLNIYLNDTSFSPQDLVEYSDFPQGTLGAGT